ncbi:hypothetical protein [Nitrospirillum amazonense]|uniref:hypothetical protein n=1 Tax=Nitrospirillum amazonense TaxID=28077 RepID=UPI0024125C19|nr:hypothetical protein [Nitrospirillum amazonense]MDG3443649.1 hypothetical protein [Nitrospirillum amazonense]
MTAGRWMVMMAAVALVAGCAVQHVQVVPVTMNGGPAPRPAGTVGTPEKVMLTRTVPVGQERELNFYQGLHEDCAPISGITVEILTAPAHGTASLRDGTDYPTFPAGNPRAACNKKAMPAQQLWYQPAPGYTGADVLEVQVFYPMGTAQKQTYTINIQGNVQGAAPPKPIAP